MKPIVKCTLVNFQPISELRTRYVAMLERFSEHPKLDPPNKGQTRTSLILRIDFEKKQFETMNTIYDWS